MKKAILIAVLIAISGCTEGKKSKESMESNKGKEIACGPKVVIEPAKVDAEWRTQNHNMIDPNYQDGILIDLLKASNQAEWLSANGSKIDFPKSYPFISCVHKIPETVYDTYISDDQVYEKITFDSLREAIDNHPGDITFENDNYNCYIHLQSTDGKIGLTVKDNFVANENYYSIPLFRAMLEIHKPNPAEFEVSESIKKPGVILIRVKGSAFAFYDFSQNPLLPIPGAL